jgi:hypothetical protein
MDPAVLFEMVETTKEFTGEVIWLIIGILFCLPVGLYYFIANREEMQVCPECGGTAVMDASSCPSCGESL